MKTAVRSKLKPRIVKATPKAAPKPVMKIQAATAARRMPARQVPEETHYDDEFEPSMKLSRAFLIVLIMHVVAVGGIFAFNAIKTRQISEARPENPVPESGPAGKPDARAQSIVAAANTSTAPSIPASRRHVVKPGDTPFRLAHVYGVKLEDLMAVNHMKEGALIVTGQELKIPDGPQGTAPAAQAQPAQPRKAPVQVAESTPRPAHAAPAAPVDADVKNLLGVTDAPKPPAQRSADKNTVSVEGKKTYTVAKGDNPYSIAKKLGVEYSELLKANNIDDPKKLQIGQRLVVPGN